MSTARCPVDWNSRGRADGRHCSHPPPRRRPIPAHPSGAGGKAGCQAGTAQARAARARACRARWDHRRRPGRAPARARSGLRRRIQRGYYLTAFAIATRRVEEHKDVKAMTLLGELYANGFGVERNEKKAAEWYRLAIDRGDREAMFALAMLHLGGRPAFPSARRLPSCSPPRPSSDTWPRAYDLALLYLEGQLFPQDFARAAELFRAAAQAGNPEAQYALATLYKEGRGVPKDVTEAARLLARGGAGRQYRCPGRIRHRAVQRHRRGQERGGGSGGVEKGGAQGQSDRAEPPRQRPGDRSRAAGRSGRGDQMAHRRQGRRRKRHSARRLRAEAVAGNPRRR